MSGYIYDLPKSTKILIGVLIALVIGFLGVFIGNSKDIDTITLENGYVLNFRDYEYSKDLKIKALIESYGEDSDNAISVLATKTLNSKNITYPKSVQERMVFQEDFNTFDSKEDFVMIKIPVENELDFEEIDTLLKNTNKKVKIVEMISDSNMYNVNNLYPWLDADYLRYEDVPEIFEYKSGEGIVEKYKETTNKNIQEILK